MRKMESILKDLLHLVGTSCKLAPAEGGLEYNAATNNIEAVFENGRTTPAIGSLRLNASARVRQRLAKFLTSSVR